ncbi:MAG: hypothetical protein N2320_04070 [Candidatus Bipolaricaulota bacterium]|nr:hypothetical protein [Candidatus Bipolaricaulota bacterium]
MAERNIAISGAGRIEGGRYGTVKIAGSGKVAGDLEAEEFRSSGSAKVEGDLKAGRFESAGSFRCEGSAEIGEGEAAGSFRVKGLVRTQELKLAGSAAAQGIRGGYLRATGSLAVAENVEVERFWMTGVFGIGGLLSADRVEVELEGPSRAREIGGEKISVRASPRGLGSFFIFALRLVFDKEPVQKLVVDTVEGDEVELEATEARLVRGGKVKVGLGCRIGRVEYSESLEVAPGAKVEEEVKG